jgi:hypothetical protein
MGLFGKDEPETATVRGKPLHCIVCGSEQFPVRSALSSTPGC